MQTVSDGFRVANLRRRDNQFKTEHRSCTRARSPERTLNIRHGDVRILSLPRRMKQ
jgi:hypothetical protein